MKDINNNRILNFKPENTGCYFNEDTYYWDHDEPECKYFELKKVRGILTFVDGVRYFPANDSQIHLKIDRQPIKTCRKKIFGTDFDRIYILKLKYQNPIQDSIKAKSLSLMRDYAIRDNWVFTCLTQMLRSSKKTLS